MKLLLILPKNERSYWGGVSKSGKAGFVRLNLPTIAALTPEDWDVEVHDARVKPVDYNAKVDLVGVTGFTAEMPGAYEIADNFRKKGVKVVMGGVHVSAMPDEALRHADAVVIGEAELVWHNLLDDFKKGALKPKYKADKLHDMKNMVIPKRDLLDRKMYSGFNTLQATRGCPFNCDYCAVTAFFGHEFRVRPIDEVIEEINGFDTKDFFFMDDNIVGRPKYAKELFKRLIPLKVAWGSQASITMAKDSELLELYAKSGGKYAFIGLESLSQKSLENLHKGWNSAK
ncbi:MAG: B12-binding domain-containing radical SAM protein, partial [Deltaproteobacteria bacterium]|nr:B12-binding domain-containing radical SAM protein [Deltaproteobacteria bacterium]